MGAEIDGAGGDADLRVEGLRTAGFVSADGEAGDAGRDVFLAGMRKE
jgi:hypothetical protein